MTSTLVCPHIRNCEVYQTLVNQNAKPYDRLDVIEESAPSQYVVKQYTCYALVMLTCLIHEGYDEKRFDEKSPECSHIKILNSTLKLSNDSQ